MAHTFRDIHIVDTQPWHGSSGSPVFLYNQNTRKLTYFLGVLTDFIDLKWPLVTPDRWDNSGLGIVWNNQYIHDCIQRF